MRGPDRLELSGERFGVVYHLTGTEDEARTKAADLCVEQTVEFPADLLPAGDIPDHIVGRVESFERVDERRFEALVSFAVEVAGGELTQLLNVIFGNVSIKPGVRVERLNLSPAILGLFGGPRYGREGLRELLNVPSRPLVCTAVKPMGLDVAELAELAHQFALGGVDLIKDDHGIADQSFCRFDERVTRCAEAVRRANQMTGGHTLYLPNVTAPVNELARRTQVAKRVGAGGLLVSPGLIGFDTMRDLAGDDAVDLPIMSHPALLGSFTVHPSAGFSHFALYGQLMRLAGADACIFPNYGGRFSFSESDCRAIAAGCAEPMGAIRASLPTPAGGMSLERVPEMCAFYGNEMVLLIGGDLHRQGASLSDACRRFVEIAERADTRSAPTTSPGPF